MLNCSDCKKRACRAQGDDAYPNHCPSLETEDLEKIRALYDEENKRIAHAAALVEAEGYGRLTRVEETIEFCRKMSYTHIGIAHCVGFSAEASVMRKILRHHGFAVETVQCGAGGIGKEFIGIRREEQVHDTDFEAMCNPIGQGYWLEKAGCDFVVIVGLCVGHDTLMIKTLNLPCTVMAVKDRVTGHCPVQPLYLSESYYNKKLYPDR